MLAAGPPLKPPPPTHPPPTAAQVTQRTMDLLYALARRQRLREKIAAMCRGDKVNVTEGRAVLHTALRSAPDDAPIVVDGVNVVEDVHEVLRKVSARGAHGLEGVQRGR